MNTMFWVWLSIIVVTVLVEVVTTDLVSIWFTFGAIVPLILASINVLNPIWQTVIFVIISAVLIATLRKTTLKYLFKNSKESKTNLDAFIGQKFRLIDGTDFETLGKVKVKDIEWSVKGENQQTIKKGQVVEVIRVEGNKFIVKPSKEESKEDNTESKPENNTQKKTESKVKNKTENKTKTSK